VRILFTSIAPPFPATNGQRIRNWSLLRALYAEGHHITLVSFQEKGDANAGLAALHEVCAEVEFVSMPIEKGPRALRRLWSATSLQPYGVHRFHSAEMMEKIREITGRQAFDAVFCDDVYLVQNLPRELAVPVVLNKHDLTHVIVRRYLRYETSPLKQIYGWLEYAKLRRWEIRCCLTASRVLSSSEVDRNVLHKYCPDTRIYVVPNVIDPADYQPTGEDDGSTLLYMGAMDWYPNIDAVEFFLSAIFPKIREQIPNARFVVVGRNPSERIRNLCKSFSGVEFMGWVPDVRPVLSQAAVCVIPLRIGSGTRLKIVEAAAMEKPVVSTALGAEGLSFTDGREILLTDYPQAFADASVRLLRDASLRELIGRAARKRVDSCYSVGALRHSLRSALHELDQLSETVDKRKV
jgi:polysaccharide biosynthesis protein PslH